MPGMVAKSVTQHCVVKTGRPWVQGPAIAAGTGTTGSVRNPVSKTKMERKRGRYQMSISGLYICTCSQVTQPPPIHAHTGMHTQTCMAHAHRDRYTCTHMHTHTHTYASTQIRRLGI